MSTKACTNIERRKGQGTIDKVGLVLLNRPESRKVLDAEFELFNAFEPLPVNQTNMHDLASGPLNGLC
jgi:hypothetical protein